MDPVTEKILLITKRDTPPLLCEPPLVPGSIDRPIVAPAIGKLATIPPPEPQDLKYRYGAYRSQPTGMDMSPDGCRAVVPTYKHAYLYHCTEYGSWADAFGRQPHMIPLPLPQDQKDLRQREAVCFTPDGRRLPVTSEGKGAALFRVNAE